MKITPDIERRILGKSAEGNSSRAISAWLKSELGVVVSHVAVGNVLRATRLERADVAKAVVRERLAPLVVSDVETLERQRRRLSKLVRRLRDRAFVKLDREKSAIEATGSKDHGQRDGGIDLLRCLGADEATKTLLKAEEALAKAVDLKLHYSGADAGGGESDESPLRVFLPPEEE